MILSRLTLVGNTCMEVLIIPFLLLMGVMPLRMLAPTIFSLNNLDKPPPVHLAIQLRPVAATRALLSPALPWRVGLHEAALTILVITLNLLIVSMGVMPLLLRLVSTPALSCSFVILFMALRQSLTLASE